jgi:hypothetical protein
MAMLLVFACLVARYLESEFPPFCRGVAEKYFGDSLPTSLRSESELLY